MKTTSITESLATFRRELEEERVSILRFWSTYMVDADNGGFHGSLDNDHRVQQDSPKGIVLNSRILWTFSAAYNIDKQDEYLRIAVRAFDYILKYFTDKDFGGVYWSVDRFGNVIEDRKQTYGQAFCIYGLTEFYKISSEPLALETARNIFFLLEKHCFDGGYGGYIEALAVDWTDTDDLRLSEKDQNEKKTMNTHLHVIEAYANLYQVWPNELLADRIKHLLDIFKNHIINPATGHLNLFMDEKWNLKSSLVSFGHDIEAAWLLAECADVIADEASIAHYKTLSIDLAVAASRGIASDGGLWYEYDSGTDVWIREKHSWPQAEAIVGFLNTWHLTGKDEWLDRALNTWNFIKENLKDKSRGEWFWGIGSDGKYLAKEKAGFWKCPYHGVRACMEAARRVNTLTH